MKEPKFKKGDRVVLKDDGLGSGILEPGQIYTVRSCDMFVYFDKPDNDCGGWWPDRFKLAPAPRKKHRWTVEEEIMLWESYMHWHKIWGATVAAYSDGVKIQFPSLKDLTPAAIRSKLYELIRIDEGQS
jgi:hypothetical protein